MAAGLFGSIIVPIGIVFAVLGFGVYLVQVMNQSIESAVSGREPVNLWSAPLRKGVWLWHQQHTSTERPDYPLWRAAPALYFTLAAIGISIVPFSAQRVAVDLSTGIVLWGSVEALATVVIFLHGWSANAVFPLLGAYRYVALGLSYILISMFVLIGVALPAESLQLSTVVDSQTGLWNVVRQPLGLPLFLVVGLGVTFWGPLNLADSSDLARGTAAEISGAHRLAWGVARSAMLVAFSAIAASAFLGGWLGPWLPGPVWLFLKMLLVLAVLLILGQMLARISPERFVLLAWLFLLPLSFVDLLWAGLLAL